MHCDLVVECDLTHNYVSSCVRVLYICVHMHTSRGDRSALAHSGSQHTQKRRIRAVDANCGHREVANSKFCTGIRFRKLSILMTLTLPVLGSAAPCLLNDFAQIFRCEQDLSVPI